MILLSLSEHASRGGFCQLAQFVGALLGPKLLADHLGEGRAAGHSGFQFTLDFEKVNVEK